jgi:ABC-2 type transport system permease protein
VNTFIWLLRRELWEHRSTYLRTYALLGVAPLIMLCAGLFSPAFPGLTSTLEESAAQIASHGRVASTALYTLSIPALVFVMSVQLGYFFACLGTERWDRSILFWKSLPVSDTATVLSKMGFGLLVLPALSMVWLMTVQLLAFLLVSIRFSGSGELLSALWSPVAWGNATASTLYVMVQAQLLFLPFLAWQLLVSAGSPRSQAWAGMGLLLTPCLLLSLVLAEKVSFGTAHLREEIVGRFELIAAVFGGSRFSLSPADLPTASPLAGTSFWAGLAISAVFTWAAIEIRHRRHP